MNNIILEKKNKERDLEYWQSKIGVKPAELTLPFDHPRPSVSSFESEFYNFTIEKDIKENMKDFSKQENVSTSILIMTILKILLHRYCNEEDISIGAHISKKEQLNINTLVLRTQLQTDMTFRDALKEVTKVVLEAYEHQISFTRLVDEFGEKLNGNNPFFQVMLNIRNLDFINQEKSAHGLEKADIDYSGFVDLSLEIKEMHNGLKCSFLYDRELFEKETIIRISRHFNRLLEEVLVNPEITISRIPILTNQERNQLLVEWNKPTISYPRNSSINQLFEEQVKLHPDNVALVFGDKEMTYKELNKRANQIANYLRKLNLTNKDLVAICLNRSIDMLASILGVLKAGGAYVPVDLSYPKKRIGYMLNDSGASYVITTESISNKLPNCNSKLICIDKEVETIATQPSEFSQTSDPENLAYVIYTSGSTGKPKGVSISHRGVVRLVKNITYANIEKEDTFINLTPIAFDASAFEIYGSLLNGAKLVILNSNKPTFKEIAKEIEKKKVTILGTTPSKYNVLLEDYTKYLKGLKQVLLGGEILPVRLAQKSLKRLKGCHLINVYGPTENSVNTTSYHVKGEVSESYTIPIGRPISNDRVYILDKYLQPVPIGVIGELYMSGDGIAKGYLNRKELTNERFIPDPFHKSEGRLYKSGDLVRYRSDGNIEFIGRKDDQVKIRGARIELGEIESIVGLCPGVRQAVAGTYIDRTGNKDLVAYVVMNNGVKFDQQKIRFFIQDKLPQQMVPTFFVELEDVPITPVGKIDRKRLPEPVISVSEQITLPRNQTEEKLVQLWETLLGVKPIGVKDHYFELGGNSLLAMQLFSEIEKEFNKNLPVSIIFKDDTIEKLAKHITSNESLIDTSSSLVPIQPLGIKPPFFCIHGGGGEVLVYRDLALELGDEQPLYGLKFVNNEVSGESISVEMLADRYIKEIRKIQPTGPYHLLGYCFGGAIAHEMAYKLLEERQKVSLLAILNFANPMRKPVEITNSVKKSNNYKVIIGSNLRQLFNMPLKQRATFLKSKVKNAIQLVRTSPATVKVSNRTILREAINLYKPNPYPNNMLLIRANEYKGYEENLGWDTTKNGRIYEYNMQADHEALLKEPNVKLVVKYLGEYLTKVNQ
ncbi:non-ribosomal peptide synthetase [Oceanobacillus halophilus]|uniref:Amino acid adenylation domain-containing protein n=1 Tax=Oceanobacillus halophilus TaxID=930130 RepID=A0A495A1W5_9BACI|nr:non-ribosomal peptide synthetase [Oceanobacillus halophilus]RKQ33480.1 amino acid adenylation domain-containing protein [Oceanobacillus halophilus]